MNWFLYDNDLCHKKVKIPNIKKPYHIEAIELQICLAKVDLTKTDKANFNKTKAIWILTGKNRMYGTLFKISSISHGI